MASKITYKEFIENKWPEWAEGHLSRRHINVPDKVLEKRLNYKNTVSTFVGDAVTIKDFFFQYLLEERTKKAIMAWLKGNQPTLFLRGKMPDTFSGKSFSRGRTEPACTHSFAICIQRNGGVFAVASIWPHFDFH